MFVYGRLRGWRDGEMERGREGDIEEEWIKMGRRREGAEHIILGIIGMDNANQSWTFY